ncbi:MAG: hypothetical protein OGM67_03135 [Oscillospiraceae bacterium]|nr:MAG: hypothetical protein OGM67_03135 [Oscillospiraceae bacterium]
MTALLHVAGGMLLLCAGMGCGFTAAAHIRDCQRQLHSLSRLFGYLAELLNAQALAGPELLHRAARCPEFADFCPAGAAALADLQLPSCLPEALRCEALQTLRTAEESPRLTACAALHRLAALCEGEACSRSEQYRAAQLLWPRLGACLGVLAAILLW